MRRNLQRIAIVAVLVGLGIMFSIPTATPQEQAPHVGVHRSLQFFGMVGVARGQTARLNVANLQHMTPPDGTRPGEFDPPAPIYPPGPCRVLIALLNGDGDVIQRGDFVLKPGVSGFIDWSSEWIPKDLNRMEIRAEVLVVQEIPAGRGGNQIPPGPCRATFEVFDTETGRTQLHALPSVTELLPAVQK